MFSARLGSRLSRLGNIVLGYISQPFVPPLPFGTRNKALIENHAARINLQSSNRAAPTHGARRSNTQTNRRR